MEYKREFKYPAIYRHFNGLLYSSIGISTPKNLEHKKSSFLYSEFNYMDKDESIVIYEDMHGEKFHNQSLENQELALLISLYPNEKGEFIQYAKPIKSFLSYVEKGEYYSNTLKFEQLLEQGINSEWIYEKRKVLEDIFNDKNSKKKVYYKENWIKSNYESEYCNFYYYDCEDGSIWNSRVERINNKWLSQLDNGEMLCEKVGKIPKSINENILIYINR